LKLFVLSFVILLSACTTTTTFDLNEIQPSKETKTKFHISIKDGPSSELIQEVGTTFCNTSFSTIIESVNGSSDWDNLAKVTFEDSTSSEHLAILFYFEEALGTVTPLIKHSADDFAEPLGMEFAIGEKISAIVYLDDMKFGISLEPASKLYKLVNLQVETGHKEKFEFSILELDFVPNVIKFRGFSIDAVFDDIRVNHGC